MTTLEDFMKSLFIFLAAGIISISAFAKTETSSFKTISNQTVTVGDSLNELIDRTGQSPQSMKSTTWQEGQSTMKAMEYEYNIGDNIYSITVVHEKILKIEFRKNI